MTLIDALVGTAILVFFFTGFTQVAFPVLEAWNRSNIEYREAKSLEFVAGSFRNECAKEDRNIKEWEKAVSVTKELTGYDIEELKEGGELVAMRLTCMIGSGHYEIIALCNEADE